MSEVNEIPPAIPEFIFDETTYHVTAKMKQDFRDSGIIIVRNMITKEAVGKAVQGLESASFQDDTWELADGSGKAMRMLVWRHPGSDVLGMIARSNKIVNTCEELLGGEVYHYHGKIMMKEAQSGGEQLWHQDYGYWYINACLKPDMMTVFVPLDPCTKETGCLQVIPGSHRCGRIDHAMVGGQMCADDVRMNQILESHEFPLVYAEAQPGDAIFFHSNVLHKSDANMSKFRRWCYLMAYNRRDNNPLMEHICPCYTPIKKVDDKMIMACEIPTNLTEKEVIGPSENPAITRKSSLRWRSDD